MFGACANGGRLMTEVILSLKMKTYLFTPSGCFRCSCVNVEPALNLRLHVFMKTLELETLTENKLLRANMSALASWKNQQVSLATPR